MEVHVLVQALIDDHLQVIAIFEKSSPNSSSFWDEYDKPCHISLLQ
jgi:hypothetical protein